MSLSPGHQYHNWFWAATNWTAWKFLLCFSVLWNRTKRKQLCKHDEWDLSSCLIRLLSWVVGFTSFKKTKSQHLSLRKDCFTFAHGEEDKYLEEDAIPRENRGRNALIFTNMEVNPCILCRIRDSCWWTVKPLSLKLRKKIRKREIMTTNCKTTFFRRSGRLQIPSWKAHKKLSLFLQHA